MVLPSKSHIPLHIQIDAIHTKKDERAFIEDWSSRRASFILLKIAKKKEAGIPPNTDTEGLLRSTTIFSLHQKNPQKNPKITNLILLSRKISIIYLG